MPFLSQKFKSFGLTEMWKIGLRDEYSNNKSQLSLDNLIHQNKNLPRYYIDSRVYKTMNLIRYELESILYLHKNPQ